VDAALNDPLTGKYERIIVGTTGLVNPAEADVQILPKQKNKVNKMIRFVKK
jgi:hypothetical protein